MKMEVTKPDWNGWTLDKEYGVLVGQHYKIYLDECTTSSKTLDWIAQVSHKTWANDRVLAGLVRALDEVLNMQGNLCPRGTDKRIKNIDEIISEVR
jgi:hypothetical protein